MKILYLKLQNFANIYAGMGKTEVEIDFSKCRNQVTLFIGNNGSGKTSLLSELHPFAYSTNIDVRNNISLILDNKSGYKEIHIQDDNHIYKITHHYIRKGDKISLKSYIRKDDIELNPNGNVSSFKEIVNNELTVDPSYLMLLRLGSNVTNFMLLSKTERKTYISSKLQDISVYNEYMKNVTIHDRNLSARMKIISDKLNDLRISDVEEFESSIKKKLKEEKELTKLIGDLQIEYGSLDGRIELILNESSGSIHKRLVQSEDELENSIRLKRELESCIAIVTTIPLSEYVSILDKELREIETKKTKLSVMIESHTDKSKFISDRINSISQELSRIKSLDDMDRIMDKKKSLEDRLSSIGNKYKTGTRYTSEYISDVINIIDKINIFLSRVVESPDKLVHEVFRYFGKKKNPKEELHKEQLELHKKISLSTYKNSYSSITKPSKWKLSVPKECNVPSCPLIELLSMIDGDKKDIPIHVLEQRLEDVNIMLGIIDNLDTVIDIYKENKTRLELCDIVKVNSDSLYEHAMSGKVFDKTPLYEYSEFINEVKTYENTKKEYEMVLSEISRLNNSSAIGLLESELKTEMSNMRDLRDKLEVLNDEYSDIQIKFKTKSFEINRIKEAIDTQDKIDSLSDRINELTNYIIDLKNKLSSVDEYVKKKDKVSDTIDRYQMRLKDIQDDIFVSKRKMVSFLELSKEIKVVEEEYDKITYIRKSLSPKDGIPLINIKIFFKNIERDINELLELVYGDNLYIDDFKIEDNEFSIPYVKNGIRVDDVIYSSQGESSFITIALSFALSSKAMTRYNIPLLDEIDSTLDTKNRAIFIDILERYMEKNNIEQVFMITHNNMFDSYPVDVVMTSDINSELSNQNIIFKP